MADESARPHVLNRFSSVHFFVVNVWDARCHCDVRFRPLGSGKLQQRRMFIARAFCPDGWLYKKMKPGKGADWQTFRGYYIGSALINFLIKISETLPCEIPASIALVNANGVNVQAAKVVNEHASQCMAHTMWVETE